MGEEDQDVQELHNDFIRDFIWKHVTTDIELDAK